MIFENIHIENFFRFESVNIPLSSQGLVLIEGENRDSKTSTSNGTGKSSLFEAILWCLWGKTIRGKSGDEVVNRIKKSNCVVELLVNNDGEHYQISRYRKHTPHKNKLYFKKVSPAGEVLADLTGAIEKETQAEIDKFLGVTYDTYTQGPMMPQGSFKRFSQMTDAGMKEVLENALSVSVISDAQKLASEKLKDIQGKLAISISNQERENLSLNSIQSTLRDLRFAKANWRIKVVTEAYSAYRDVVNVISSIEETWNLLGPDPDVEKYQAQYDNVLATKNKMEDAWRKEHEEATAIKIDLQSKLKIKKELVKEIDSEIERLESLKDAKCPTCEQKVTKQHIASCVEPLEQSHTEANEEIETLAYELVAQLKKIEDLIAQRNKAREQAETIIRKAQDRIVKAKEERQERLRHQQIFAHFQEQLDKARRTADKHWEALTSSDPFEETIIKMEKDEFETQGRLNNLKTEISALENQESLYKFWCAGFSNSGLKSHIFANVTPFMNKRAAFYTRELTDGETTVTFHTQRKLKSGETREQFAVEVDNKNGSGTYQGDSEGEKARSDLAINFAISDLVATRARKSYPQRWFDEPFESMDEAGVEAVMDLLTKMVHECGSIFVVTHQSGMKALFNKSIKFVKENGITRVQE